MRRPFHNTIGIALALYTCVLASCAPKDDVKQSETEVDRFHQRWDQLDFTGIFNDAHINFRTAQTPQLTIAQLQHNRNYFGRFKSATHQNANVSSANSEKDVSLNYQSVYERGTANEVFTFRITRGRPLLMNYKMLPGKRDNTR